MAARTTSLTVPPSSRLICLQLLERTRRPRPARRVRADRHVEARVRRAPISSSRTSSSAIAPRAREQAAASLRGCSAEIDAAATDAVDDQRERAVDRRPRRRAGRQKPSSEPLRARGPARARRSSISARSPRRRSSRRPGSGAPSSASAQRPSREPVEQRHLPERVRAVEAVRVEVAEPLEQLVLPARRRQGGVAHVGGDVEVARPATQVGQLRSCRRRGEESRRRKRGSSESRSVELARQDVFERWRAALRAGGRRPSPSRCACGRTHRPPPARGRRHRAAVR